jgi:leukotriene-A4 hydrolase
LPYVKAYVARFEGKSITTEMWRSHLFEYYGGVENGDAMVRKLGKVDWDEVSDVDRR